ncbi:hypothetical protein SLEP1_g57051 [Rubroshorea leprosula]|uniref:Major facilitator superfamily (MFS) profile domain-containing protein n=1 Tax=Rubroshorea leprosula TaxID=152421 RepID=A0AAV5MLD9_9ROSI|nr:hypothetical protein SLEP1_g57051 [Rubroshorea leprosula]
MSLAVVGVAIVTVVGKVKTWIVTAFDKAKEWVVATFVAAVVVAVGKAKEWVFAAVGKAKEWVFAAVGKAKEWVFAAVGKAKEWVFAAVGKAKKWVVATIGKAKESARQYKGGLYVFLTCIVAIVDGLLFGYNIGISGGVTTMNGFLQWFFPTVFEKIRQRLENNYCKYNNQGLIAFNSSSYLGALVASLVASLVTKKYGRRVTIICAGLSLLVGAVLNIAFTYLFMLFLGRIMLGFGTGFEEQAVPLYLSEMAPVHLEEIIKSIFKLAIKLGTFIANVVNYRTKRLDYSGWRISIGLTGVLALFVTMGAILLPETPKGLIEQGKREKGKRILAKIRGIDDVNTEFEDMIHASDLANSIEHPFRKMLERRNIPILVMAICMPAFKILTGMSFILFYAPVFFQSIGFGENASLYCSIVIVAVMVASAFISIATVDRLGRRVILISGGIQMILCQIIIAIILGLKFGDNQSLSKGYSALVVVVLCLFVLAFEWSWEPLSDKVLDEIFTSETELAGKIIKVVVDFLFTFIIAQSSLSMLCTLKFGIFLFFASCNIIMTLFVYMLVPETKGVPIEETTFLWKNHWLWKRIVPA